MSTRPHLHTITNHPVVLLQILCTLAAVLVPCLTLPAGFPGVRVPVRPPVESLQQTARLQPDLSVKDLCVRLDKSPKGEKKIPATVTVRVFNAGGASAPASRLHFSLTGVGIKDSHTLPIKALHNNQSLSVKWKTHVLPGRNRITVRVDDARNPANNTAMTTLKVKRPFSRPRIPHAATKTAAPVSSLAHPIPTLPIPDRKKFHPDLAVTGIAFNDFKADKPNESWVKISLKNVGTAASPPSHLRGILQRADGSRERNTLSVPMLRPGQATIIEGPIRMTPGKNTLRVIVQDPYNIRNNRKSASHFFGRWKKNMTGKSLSGLQRRAVPTSRPSPPDNSTSMSMAHALADGTADKLTRTKIRPQAVSTGSIRMEQNELHFILPPIGAILVPGQNCRIRLKLPQEAGDRLRIILHATDTTAPSPDQVLLDQTIPSESSYGFLWPVPSSQPMGAYELRLERSNGSAAEIAARLPIRIDRSRFSIKEMNVTPAEPQINRLVTVSARLVNLGTNAPEPFENRVIITGPRSFHTECSKRVDHLNRTDPAPTLSCSFIPPFRGTYQARFIPDSSGKYPGSTESLPSRQTTKIIHVRPLPDLLASVNKVSDGIQGVDRKHFHLRVKNIGSDRSPATTLLFRLTDMDDKNYTVPALEPGQIWEHEYTRKLWHSTGIKHYSLLVDPDNRITEINENNNTVRDSLHIYRPGEPMPEQHRASPHFTVVGMYGFPKHPVAGTTYTFTFRVINDSPHRQIFPPPMDADDDCAGPWGVGLADTGWPFLVEGGPIKPIQDNWVPGETRNFSFKGRWYPDNLQKVSDETVNDKLMLELSTYNRKNCQQSREGVDYFIIKQWHVTVQMPANRGARTVARAMGPAKVPILGQGKKLSILSPLPHSFLDQGQTLHIAWTGKTGPPFTVSLVPVNSPDQAVVIGRDIRGYALDHLLDSSIPPGSYRIKVKSEDGRGVSQKFSIRAGGKPDLAVRAASIDKSLSHNQKTPYSIRIRAIIENRGGYLNRGFSVRMEISSHADGGHRQNGGSTTMAKVLAEKTIKVPALLGRSTFPVEQTMLIPSADSYDIRIMVDSDQVVEESNEQNNLFTKTGYQGLMLPDLRPYCLQEGGGISCWVVNQGARESEPTLLTMDCARRINSGPLLPNGRWSFLLPTAPIKRLAPGSRVKIERGLPFAPDSNDICTATVGLPHPIAEETYENNRYRWRLHPAGENHPVSSSLNNLLRIKDLTQHNYQVVEGSGSNQTNPVPGSLRKKDYSGALKRLEHFPAHPRFHFILSATTKTTPPLSADLILHDARGYHLVRSWDIPPLFPAPETGPVDQFPLEYTANMPRGITIRYNLSIRSRSTGEQWTAASGAVQISR